MRSLLRALRWSGRRFGGLEWLGLALVLSACKTSVVRHANDLPGPRFEESASARGLAVAETPRSLDLCAGVAFVDWDDDGHVDVLATDEFGPTRLWRNVGPPTFTFAEATAESGLADALPGATCVFVADLVGDKAKEVLLMGPSAAGLALLEGHVGQPYRDITATQLEAPRHRYFGAAAGDPDGDGRLDLVLSRLTTNHPEARPDDCLGLVLLRNRDDVLAWAPDETPPLPGCSFAGAFLDVDADGDVDLIQVNDYGPAFHPNSVVLNDGLDPAGKLRWKAAPLALGLRSAVYGMGLAVGDVNGDGLLDHFMTSIGRDVLLLGRPDGTVADMTEPFRAGSELGDGGRRFKWGTAIVDVDNDGFDDILAVAANQGGGQSTEQFTQPGRTLATWSSSVAQRPLLLRGSATPPLEDVARAAGLGDLDTAIGLAVGDLDRDGGADLLVGSLNTVRLFRNVGTRGHFVQLVLRGTVSNRDAAGTSVSATCGDRTTTHAHVLGGSVGSSSEPMVHVGLGACSGPIVLDLRWPSGLRERRVVGDLDRRVVLEEPQWLSLSAASAPADGQSSVTVTLRPVEPLKALPRLRVDGAAAGDYAFAPTEDGAFVGTLIAPATPGESVLTLPNLDGVSAHPRIRWRAPASVRWAIPWAQARPSAPLRVGATLLDAAGLPTDGVASIEVTGAELVPSVATSASSVVASVVPSAAATQLTLRARRNGQPWGEPRVVPLAARVDLDYTRVHVTPNWVEQPQTLTVTAVLRDATGSEVDDLDASELTLLVAGAPISPPASFRRAGSVYLAELDSRTLVLPTELRVRAAGSTPAQSARVRLWSAAAAVGALSAERSKLAFMDRYAPGDGEVVLPLLLTLTDSDGQRINERVLSLATYETVGCELVAAPARLNGVSAFHHAGHVRVTGPVGSTASVTLWLNGVKTNVSASIPIVSPTPTAPALELTRVSLFDPETYESVDAIDGPRPLLLRVEMMDGNGNLAGSGLGVSVTSTSLALDATAYVGYGRYEARFQAPSGRCQGSIEVQAGASGSRISLQVPAGSTEGTVCTPRSATGRR